MKKEGAATAARIMNVVQLEYNGCMYWLTPDKKAFLAVGEIVDAPPAARATGARPKKVRAAVKKTTRRAAPKVKTPPTRKRRAAAPADRVPDGMVTALEAANRLGCSVQALYHWRDVQRLRMEKVAGRTYCAAADVERIIQEKKEKKA